MFGLIERFSEDIDLILDWNEIASEDPNLNRSKSKQDQFNRSIQMLSQKHIGEVVLPEVLRLMDGVCSAKIEEGAPDVINVCYPSKFSDGYLRPEIRLEIGPLAQWVPHARYAVTSYVQMLFPICLRTHTVMLLRLRLNEPSGKRQPFCTMKHIDQEARRSLHATLGIIMTYIK